MPVFQTEVAIRKSLGEAGLIVHADAIIKSALPCIVFLRRQLPETDVTLIKSRMGGMAAAPDGFEWPVAPPFKNAKKRAKALDESIEDLSGEDDDPIDEDFIEEMVAVYEPDDPEKYRAEMRAMMEPDEPQSQEYVAQITAAIEAEKAALFETFPMAFVGQINLAELSGSKGFDPALPTDGVLAIFRDIRDWDGQTKLYHFTEKDGNLAQMPPPDRLITYFDAKRLPTDSSWADLEYCEVLEPHFALSVPHHWGVARYGDDLADWLMEPDHVFYPEDDQETADFFGEQLGGYPEVLQGLPEFDLDPKLKPKKVIPGELPWRMVFSYCCEHYDSSRQMYAPGDGQTYLMMHEDDWAAWNLSKVIENYQQT